jgi:hypothetical protein
MTAGEEIANLVPLSDLDIHQVFSVLYQAATPEWPEAEAYM